MAYKVLSPLIANVKIVSRATFSGPKVVDAKGVEGMRKKPVLRASKRAKMYFVRDQPNRLVSLSFFFRIFMMDERGRTVRFRVGRELQEPVLTTALSSSLRLFLSDWSEWEVS